MKKNIKTNPFNAGNRGFGNTSNAINSIAGNTSPANVPAFSKPKEDKTIFDKVEKNNL